MECIMQYLDDLEDFLYAAAFRLERVRRALRLAVLGILTIGLQAATFLLALVQPPLALAVASLLCVGILYRAAVYSPRSRQLTAKAF